MKKRLDEILVEQGLAETRSKARSMILAGWVKVDGKKIDKAGHQVKVDANIEVKDVGLKFVSRGGLKLEHALKEFQVDVKGLTCVDIGASTGGFTDCLLQNGAKKVYAIDVGYGQLDWKLRKDERVIVIEKTNIREFNIKQIQDPIDLAVVDVSFIGLEKVFPKINELNPKQIIALIKPQFQVGKGKVGKGGVVRDEKLHEEAIETVKTAAEKLNWVFKGLVTSPITGPAGNIEFLAWWMYQ